MKTLLTLSVLVLAFGFAGSAGAKADCKEKRKAMHNARIALRECNKAWIEAVRSRGADPSDDCQAKQTAFVSSTKELKACFMSESGARAQ